MTKGLAEFVITTKTADVPQEVLDGARDAFIDTMGCGLAGTLEEAGRIIVDFLRTQGGNAQATLWGSGFVTSMTDAAFANGVFSHVLDFDDTHRNLRGHPSATLVPAIMAAGEYARVSGHEALAAFAVGLEIAGKLGRAFGSSHYAKGWHPTSTVGTFSATAAAARLLELSVNQLRHAFGIAASELSGVRRNFGTMTKSFHSGHAARSGVLAASLAKSGFTADNSIFDGKDGILSVYSSADTRQLSDLLLRLARPWEMTQPGIGFKRWPCCYSNHRSIGGLLQMISEHGLNPNEIEVVEVGFTPGADAPLISKNPQTGLQGKFSIEYVISATLLDGEVTMQTFTDRMVNRPEVRRLMKKVRRYQLENPGPNVYNDLTVRTTHGEFRMHIDRTPGSRDWPASASERSGKFMDCAGRVLGEKGAGVLLDLLLNCQSLEDLSTLSKAAVWDE